MNPLVSMGIARPSNILVIEDLVGFALDLAEYLVIHGHTVLALTGIDLMGERYAPRHVLYGELPENLELEQFDFCFLDHYFESSNLTGTTLMPSLFNADVRVIGMSSSGSANERMKYFGAHFAYEKHALKLMLGLQ
jgi:hypothetical protein